MTRIWKQVLIGAALAAGIAATAFVVRPGRLWAASLQGGGNSSMMQGGMMSGSTGSMMGNTGSMMNGMMGGEMAKMHDAMTGMHQKELDAAASALGMTAEDLTKALAAGRGVADLAKEKGVDVATVASAVESARKATFDELVAAGAVTREQADQMLDHMGKAGFMVLNGAATMQNGGACHMTQTQKS